MNKEVTYSEAALYIVKTLQDKNYQAVYAGGCVRDMLMKRTPKDIDIATSALPDQIEQLFKRTIPVGKAFGVINVLIEDHDIEVATFRSDGNYDDGRRPESIAFCSMKEDARRRDLTINGLFLDPIKNQIYDFVNGQQDILLKTIRFIGNPEQRIQEDKLRMLRATRFATQFTWPIEAYSAFFIKRCAHEINQISNERIQEELTKILQAEVSFGFKGLLDLHLLQYVLPEIYKLKGCQQNKTWHPEGDVWMHTLYLLHKLSEYTDNKILLWAGLLHDVGKPETTYTEDGIIKSKEHAKVGAKIAEKILKRLKFSNKETEAIYQLVYNHMSIKQAKEMRKSTLRKYLGRPDIENLMTLSYYDSLAGIGDVDWYRFLIKKKIEFKNEQKPILPPCLLNGYDLISLGFKPGPEFKKILENILDLQLEDQIISKEQALKFVKENYVAGEENEHKA